jgi:hypothetical protein
MSEMQQPDLQATPDSRSRVSRPPIARLVRSVFILVVFAGLGAIIGYVFASNFRLPFELHSGLAVVGVILATILALFASLLVHEGGHLLGGRIVGFRFLLLIVGPLRIMREQQGIRVGLNRNLASYGGLAASMPLDLERLPQRMLIIAIAGPLASLILALLAFLLQWITAAYPALAIVFLLLALTSAAIFLATVLPFGSKGFFSDGGRAIMLYKGGPRVERWCALVTLQSAMMAGQLPRSWNVSLVQRITSLPDESLDDVMGCYLGYYWAIDSGDVSAAKRYLNRMLVNLSGVPSLVRPNFVLEAAYFEACFAQNAQSARAWLNKAKRGMIDRCTRLRVEAAVLFAEGKLDEARQKAEEGLEAVKKATLAGTGRIEEAWLHSLLELQTRS